MRHDKLEMQLELLLLLTGNRGYTVEELCDRLHISRRNFYYYIEFFRDCGFIVYKQGRYYSIDRNSTFFRRLQDRLDFTEDEVLTIRNLLDKTDAEDAVVSKLKLKLDRFYDFNILADMALREQVAANLHTIYDAIKFKRLIKIFSYSSPHSQTVSDRVVEPYLMMNNNRSVRCYEVVSGMNKTFRLSRMKSVEMLELTWDHEEEHRPMHTDIFMFSDEQQTEVELLLGPLAGNVLQEEYPASTAYMTLEGENRWRVILPVCSYQGIGRFVMGLFEDIEVIAPDSFKHYLKEKTMQMMSKFER